MEKILIGKDSEVVIGRDLIPDELLSANEERRRVAILRQPTVEPIANAVMEALREQGMAVLDHAIPDGEAAKTLETAGAAYQALAAFGLGRKDTILGIGGGAATDLAGFVAATWLRGVESSYFSTTLVGAVDAAIGGKTGLNLGGKNLIGAFWHPRRIVIDIGYLERLGPDLLRQGHSEALKTGLIGDSVLVDLYAAMGSQAPLDEVVTRSATVKAAVVSEDLRESGRRAYLNYGHTLGHGIEMVGRLSHGDAVAIGMVAAGAIAEEMLGFAHQEHQRRIIESLGLPTTAEGLSAGAVKDLIRLDKKRSADSLRMVLLRDIQEPVLVDVDDGMVELGLSAVGIR